MTKLKTFHDKNSLNLNTDWISLFLFLLFRFLRSAFAVFIFVCCPILDFWLQFYVTSKIAQSHTIILSHRVFSHWMLMCYFFFLFCMVFYREDMEKVNIKFHDNYTVTYQHKKILQFVPELSIDRNVRVMTPNIPLLVSSSILLPLPNVNVL